MIFFFFKYIIWNIDIHTCLLDSTFLCPHLYYNRRVAVLSWEKYKCTCFFVQVVSQKSLDISTWNFIEYIVFAYDNKNIVKLRFVKFFVYCKCYSYLVICKKKKKTSIAALSGKSYRVFHCAFQCILTCNKMMIFI